MKLGRFLNLQERGASWNLSGYRDAHLGVIEWNADWRLYEYVPALGSALSSECLRDLAGFLERETARRRAAIRNMK